MNWKVLSFFSDSMRLVDPMDIFTIEPVKVRDYPQKERKRLDLYFFEMILPNGKVNYKA